MTLRLARLLAVLAVGMVAALANSTAPASAAQAPILLGTASSFSVLAGSAVTNTGPTVLSADLGVSPSAAISGFPPGIVGGTTHAADAAAAQAQLDVTTAYNDAASRGPATAIVGDLGGQTLVPGAYAGGAVSITGTITLDGQGDPNAVFVIKAASTLITASTSSVSLIGGARACNVVWQVTSSATLGTSTSFAGTILALESITANTGAIVNGQLFARNGAVTLDSNTITSSQCAAVATTTSTSTTTTSSTTSTTTPAVTTTTVTTPPAPVGVAGGGPTTTVLSSSSTELPRTGSHTTELATLGLFAVLLGWMLVRVAARPSGR